MLFARRKRLIKRLLIVEDEPLVAFDTEHFLREHGYEIAGTLDRVADARAALSAGGVDLVLVDMNLADGTGLDVAQHARSLDVPVLFVTGACPVGGDAVAHGCLAKPYAQRDLLSAIEAIEAVAQGKPPKRLPPALTLFPQAA